MSLWLVQHQGFAWWAPFIFVCLVCWAAKVWREW